MEVVVRKPVLRGSELAFVASVVSIVYCSALACLHYWVSAAEAAGAASAGTTLNFWGTLPSAWDHPEPNYLVSPAIGEFWSVLTTIPIAGTLLLYEGLKYSYGWKVLRIYVLTCGMYTLAFSSHLTLQRHFFSTTVTAVMSNALLTFAEFSGIVHWMLRSAWVRGFVVLAAEVLLVGTVATLPYVIDNGGVWTLFTVQAPGVFLATVIASGLAYRAKSKEERSTYRTVFVAGCLLSSAMVLSFFECLYGFEHGVVSNLMGFPWLHIAIHVFEQVGIYIFGVGVAALHELLFLDKPRAGAEVRFLASFMPYLYCPSVPGDVATPEKGSVEARGRSRLPVDLPPETGAGAPLNRTGSFESDTSPNSKAHPTLNKRRRDKTPGTLPIGPVAAIQPNKPAQAASQPQTSPRANKTVD